MDTSGMQPFLWRLMFIVLIYAPGSTLNAIKGSPVTSTAATITVMPATTTAESPSLLRSTINDRTFQKTPSNTQATASLIRDSFISITTTSNVTRSTRTAAAASEKEATNIRQHSLNSILAVNTTTAATVAAAPTVTSTMGQVTKATLWNSEANEYEYAEVDNSVYKTLRNDGYGSIIDYSNNNNKNNNSSNINNSSSSINEKHRTISESSINNSKSNNNNNNKGASYSSRNQQQQQQRFLQKSKHQQQQLQHESKSQEVDLAISKQYVRQVQQELSTTLTAMTTTPTTTTAAAPTIRITEVTAIYENNNLLDTSGAATAAVGDEENVREHEEEYELPTKEKLKMANPEMTTTIAITMTNATAATDAVTVLYETTLPTASSTPEATSTSAMPTAIEMAATSTTETTTTTTVKPKLPLAVDGYQTITSQAGTHAYLPCNVKQLVKKPISWLRVRDGHILTVDQTTFIADQRFQSIYATNPERWSLQIKYVQTKDAGTYECQVSTEPKTSAIVTLQIVEPKTELIGESTRHVKAGSQVKLCCIISQALEPPLFINWFYNQKQIYLHNRRGWRTEIERIELPPEKPSTTTSTTKSLTTTTSTQSTTITMIKTIGNGTAASTSMPVSSHTSMSLSAAEDREAATLSAIASAAAFPAITVAATSTMTTAAADVKQITTASLIIPSVEKQDSGNYTCSPSNSAPITVVLHVLNGEYSASAITSGISSNFILIGQRGGNEHQQRSYWSNTPTILALLWIIRFLHSMEFGRETATATGPSIKMNNTSHNKRNKCASSQAFATTATAIRPKSTIKLTERATTIPWVLTEEKT